MKTLHPQFNSCLISETATMKSSSSPFFSLRALPLPLLIPTRNTPSPSQQRNTQMECPGTPPLPAQPSKRGSLDSMWLPAHTFSSYEWLKKMTDCIREVEGSTFVLCRILCQCTDGYKY